MKKLVIWLVSIGLVLLPVGVSPVVYQAFAQQVASPSPEQSTQPPSVAQPLVREGDFAVKLASALSIGQTANEAEAESLLSAAGIAPSNGWIADYPMTPDVIGELQQAILNASASGKIPLNEEAADRAFNGVSTEFGIAISPAQGQTTETASTAPPPDNTLYTSPTTVNNYYYQNGPPVITYYAPPPDYAYLYAWVPFPFFSLGFWFPGYYCLHDFDRVVVVGPYGVHRIITNHWYDPHTRGYVLVRPAYWYGHGRYHHERFITPGRGFVDHHADRGAEAILRGHGGREPYTGTMHRGVMGPERMGPHHSEMARGGSTTHFRGPDGRSGVAPPSRMGPASGGSRHDAARPRGMSGNRVAHGSPGTFRSFDGARTWGSNSESTFSHSREFSSGRNFETPRFYANSRTFNRGSTWGHSRSFSSGRNFNTPTFHANRSFNGGSAWGHSRSFNSGVHFSRPSFSAHRSFGGMRVSRR